MRETKKSLFPWKKEIDISKENFRIYEFPGGDIVRIECPEMLVVSDNGHRVVDAQKISHYIPYGWIHLWWENIDKEKYQYYYQRQEK